MNHFFKIVAILLLFTSSFFSCTTSNLLNSNADEVVLVISYQQKAGYSKTAPEYTIELFSNRQMHLTAIKNLDKQGKFMRNLTKEEYKQLIEAFDDASFFKFENEYTANITDLPVRYLYYANDGKSKKIKNYYNVPDELKSLELMVRSYLDRVGWSQMSW